MKIIARTAALAVLGVSILGAGAFQYQTDADRRDYGGLLKINPPADAVELKIERSFPSAEQEEAGHFLNQPRAFILDEHGRFYISDQKDHIVYRFDSNGGYIGKFGREGQGPGDLSIPLHLQILGREIAVNELGNGRIQYFTLEGKPLRSVRRPHEYCDIEILADRRFVGAPSGIEPHQETMLLDVVSPDGTIIRSFGEPLPFKYHQSVMNIRKMIVNMERDVFLFFEYLAIVRKYTLDGRLIWEKPIVTPFSLAKEKINRRGNSYLPNNRPGYRPIVETAKISDGLIFITDQVGSRLWIWEMDENLSIRRTFYVEIEENCYVADFIPRREQGQMRFFALVLGSDDGEKIHVLVPKR